MNKKKIFTALKIAIPLLLAIYICWYFWGQFSESDKKSFVAVFTECNYFILFLSLFIGFISHISRAIRWKIMLRTIGYSPTTLNAYNAIMIGYISNLVLPRAGEAVRAGTLKGTDNVPFEKGFGTIIAERIIDMVCLALVTGVAFLMNQKAIAQLADILKAIVPASNENKTFPYITVVILSIVIISVAAFALLYFKKPAFKEKITSLIKGFWEGIRTIFRLEKRLAYLLHTLLIWTCYIAMFWVTFYAWGPTQSLPASGIMCAFVLGTIGFIIVQGGVGTYQILVATTITFFLAPDYLIENNKFLPEHFGFANLVWLTQTVLIIILGLISLAMVNVAKKKNKAIN